LKERKKEKNYRTRSLDFLLFSFSGDGSFIFFLSLLKSVNTFGLAVMCECCLSSFCLCLWVLAK